MARFRQAQHRSQSRRGRTQFCLVWWECRRRERCSATFGGAPQACRAPRDEGRTGVRTGDRKKRFEVEGGGSDAVWPHWRRDDRSRTAGGHGSLDGCSHAGPRAHAEPFCHRQDRPDWQVRLHARIHPRTGPIRIWPSRSARGSRPSATGSQWPVPFHGVAGTARAEARIGKKARSKPSLSITPRNPVPTESLLVVGIAQSERRPTQPVSWYWAPGEVLVLDDVTRPSPELIQDRGSQ